MNLRLLYFVICVLSYRFSSGQRLVSRGKTISSSSDVNAWTADKAVDGDARRAPNDCNCCAATQNESEPWYKLDLGQQYKIYSISVLGRGGAGDGEGGYGHTLKNMEIKLGTTELDGQILTQYTGNEYTYDYALHPSREGRYLTLTLRGMTQFFVICELSVYAECDVGYFSNDCTQRCFCLNSPCNKLTGICPAGGCIEGYKGNKCNTPCEYGKYGNNCEEDCGACYSIVTCDRFNGSCQACAPGYRGVPCKQICGNGSYGQGCAKECGHCFNDEVCNHIDGHCTTCAAGYKGADCKTECDSWTFGLNCSQQCGHCLDSVQCNKVNGSCPVGCDPGFEGALCNATCGTGKYGDNCANNCGHCYEGETCDVVTGLCSNNCSEGYTGTYCKQECPDGTFGRNCIWNCENTRPKAEVKVYQLSTALVGAIAAVSIIGNVVTAVHYMMQKRRNQREKQTKNQTDSSGPYEMTNQSDIPTQHQYENAATVYGEADSPYEIPE